MTDILIEGSEALIGGEFADAAIQVANRKIVETSSRGSAGAIRLDGRGLLALPGIVDMHGDAFERQMMPRPGVDFPIDVALVDSDRQAIANGITTVFHATTWSWEPGLRGTENAHRLLDAIETMRPQLAADTRFHLRQETYNLEAEPTIAEWLVSGRVDILAFNDHMDMTTTSMSNPKKRMRMVERSGLSESEFDALVGRVLARENDVPASIARLAAIARDHTIPLLSHDDKSPEQRSEFRAMGVELAEFPINEETARAATEAGDFTVFGAPNVVRGGSHTGWTSAADMVSKGLCSILPQTTTTPPRCSRPSCWPPTTSYRCRRPGLWCPARPPRRPACTTAARSPPENAPTSFWLMHANRSGHVLLRQSQMASLFI